MFYIVDLPMNYQVSDVLCGCESGGVVSMFQINYTRQEYSKWDSDANRALTIINIAMKRRSAEFLAILEKRRLVHSLHKLICARRQK